MKLLDDFNHWRFMKYGKEHWSLVATLHEDFTFKGDNFISRFYYRCYESNKGNRNVKFASDKSNIRDHLFVAKQRHMYNEKIVRWLEGRYDPDIPRYSETSEEDTVNALRGKI